MTLGDAVDIVDAVACLGGACASVVAMQIVGRERQPWVYVERAALGGLALTMFYNAIADSNLLGGHRPSGVAANVAMTVLLVVMVLRAKFFRRHADQN